jgi:DNA-binding response OmpR family regulator
MISPQSILPTLVVDADGAAASQLAQRLRHRAFEADFATSCRAAHVAMRTRHYDTLIVVADLALHSDLHCIASLRRRSPRTWIVVISLRCDADARTLVFQHGADALLSAPVVMDELILRLAAFGHRSRPS